MEGLGIPEPSTVILVLTHNALHSRHNPHRLPYSTPKHPYRIPIDSRFNLIDSLHDPFRCRMMSLYNPIESLHNPSYSPIQPHRISTFSRYIPRFNPWNPYFIPHILHNPPFSPTNVGKTLNPRPLNPKLPKP